MRIVPAWQRRLDVRSERRGVGNGSGYAMVALLVGLGIMAVMLSVALPTWRTLAQRERESELVFRGQQYARAIALFQRKYANAFPPSIDLLVEQRFLRRKYLDPITNDEFQPVLVGTPPPGGGGIGAGGGAGGPGGRGATAQPGGLSAQPLGGRAGIMGVTSKSTADSIREYQGRKKYNEWVFVATQASTRAGAPQGGQTPTGGGPGGGGVGPGRGGDAGPQGAPAGPGRGQRPGGGPGGQPSGFGPPGRGRL